MTRLKDGLSFQPLLRLFSAVVFHHAVVFLLLPQCCAGQWSVVGPPQPIVAALGDDIILPCHIKPAVDASEMTIEWARTDLDPRFVLVWRDGVELQNKQHPSYNGRTSLFNDELKYGDISLKLSNVKLSDEGKYRCFIPTSFKESAVEVVVGVASFIVIRLARTDEDKVGNGLVLQCESKGWYPEPEVLWLDGEGNLLSAGPTETVRGPDDLYTVSRRLTVEKSDNFICRVQQKNINQTRETHFYVPEDVLTAPSSSAVYIFVVLSVLCFLLFSATFFIFWKLRKEKMHRMHHVNGTEEGTVETDKLVEKMEDWDDGKLWEKEKEQKDMRYVISVMMEKKKELENSREELQSQLEKVEGDLKKNKNDLQSLNLALFVWNGEGKKNDLLVIKQKLDNQKTECEKSLQSIKDRLQDTEDVITRLTDWKKKVQEQIVEINKQPEETKGQRDEIQLEKEEETNQNTEASPLTHCPETEPNES